jgi:type I restriction enzyme M protein
MAIKKFDLYSSLWASCDELRGGMDASQYKDYVLFMLFIKYISDKYGDSDDFAPNRAMAPFLIPRFRISWYEKAYLKIQPSIYRPSSCAPWKAETSKPSWSICNHC